MNRKTLKINRIAAIIMLASVSVFAVVFTPSSASTEQSVLTVENKKANLESKAEAHKAQTPEAVSLKTEKRGYPLLNLQNGKRIETQFVAADGSQNSLNAAESRPVTMTNSDLNLDGAADLIVGYTGENGGGSRLAIYQGNPDSLSARTPEIFEGIKEGRFPAPFHSKANLIELPVAPDFIGAGDFNRDGYKDIVAAQRGGESLVLLAGSAKGGFSLQTIALPGRVTALLAENVDPADGQPDVAVALTDANGAWLFVFDHQHNVFAEQPRMYRLPAEATSLALGQLDDAAPMDILAAAGGKAVIVHGSFRDDSASQENQVAENVNDVEVLNAGGDVTATRIGHFVWDRENQPEIALLGSSGRIQILQRGNIDRRRYTEEEWETHWSKQEEQDQLELIRRAKERANGTMVLAPRKQLRSTAQKWTEADSFQLSSGFNLSSVSPASVFTSARMTTEGVENLIVADASSRKVKVLLQNNDELKSLGESYELSAKGDLVAVEFDSASSPAAILPMRLSVMTRPGLVMLDQETAEVSYAVAAPVATYTVTKTADTFDGTCNADCSLREAIRAANLDTTQADIVMVPPGTYTLTLGPADDSPADPSAQATGDLDVRDDLTITGAGQGSTFIQAGTSPSNGIDRVLNTRQRVVGIPDISISGVTIRNGRCVTSGSVANPSGARCNTGGAGLLHSVDDLGAVTISDSTFSTNWNVADHNIETYLNGAGVFMGRGDAVFTNVTFSNNENGATGSVNGGDGGAVLFGFSSSTNINTAVLTNCNMTGNIARLIGSDTLGGMGGAVNGAYNDLDIIGGTYSNNSADLDGGAVYNLTNMDISNNAAFTGNSAKRDGGGIWSDPFQYNDSNQAFGPGTNTITNVTVRNNTADSDNATHSQFPGDPRGAGGGIYHDRNNLTLTTVTIGGTSASQPNTSFDGGGLGHRYRAVNSTTNISAITVNGGSIVGNVANNDGGGIYHNATRTAGSNSTISVAPTTIVTLTNNQAKNHGGGVFNSGTATATFNNTTLRSNQANSDNSGGGDGGALYQETAGSTTTFNGTLTIGGSGFANSAVNGGGIRNVAGTVAMPTSSSITHNTASGSGGGISNGGTVNALTAPIITNNTAGGDGAGIHNTGTFGALLNATITNNTASSGSGGGIFNSGILATLTNPSLNSNSATNGGGIFSSNGALTITNGSVSNNTATAGTGGGIQHSGSSASTITTVQITNNNGDGIHITGTGSLDVKTNTITGNTGDGIAKLGTGTGSHFDSNTIHSNGVLGIDLGNNGVTPNDANDGDTGPNNLQNFPVLNYVRRGDGVANVTLNGVVALGRYRVQYYKNAACDPSGHGEGEVLLTSEVIIIPAATTNHTYFSPALAFDSGVREQITAIITHDVNNNNNFDDDGNTSEFSACRKVNTLPTITGQNTSQQQGSPVSNSQVATVADPDQALNTLVVTVKGVGEAGAGAASKTVNGVTVSNIAVDASGNVTADIIASCTSTNANFTLRVTDNATEFNEANFTVSVTPNTPPTVGNYPNTTVNAGSSGTVITPDAAPTDNGTVTTLTATAPGFTGTFVGNATNGTITVNNAAPAGVYTVTVTATDNCTATTTTTFQLTVNAIPTIIGATISRQQGSPSTNSQIATVNDVEDAENTLAVTVNGGASATVNGVTVSNITVDASGNVTADVVASCTATNATFTLTVTDSVGASNTATLTVNVTPNTPPTIGSYANTSLNSGGGTTVTPTAAPLDNGSVSSVTAAAPGFGGTLSVDSITGVVTISNAGPAGTYTVTVTVTDNCGATTSPTFTLTVGYSIAGTVSYGITPMNQTQQKVPDVLLSATGTSTASDTTDSMGAYQLDFLTGGGNYTVTPTKTNHVNGITAFDATLVLRHVAANGMGANALNANQLIPADTDNSNSITGFDAVLILRFVAAMGPNANTGETGKWKFVDSSKTYNPLSASLSGENYTAYLMGELDGDWTPSGMLAEPRVKQDNQRPLLTNDSSLSAEQDIPAFVREYQGFDGRNAKPMNSRGVQLFLPSNASATADGTVLIPVWLNNDSNRQISSFSFAVRFDPSVLQPEQRAIEANNTLIGSGFMVVSDQTTPGRLGIAAISPDNFAASSGTLVYLRFKVIETKSDSAASSLVFETISQTAGTFEDNFGNKVFSTAINGSFSRAGSKQ